MIQQADQPYLRYLLTVTDAHLDPGLKSGAIKSVMPDGIFYVNNIDENGFHLIVIRTKINYL